MHDGCVFLVMDILLCQHQLISHCWKGTYVAWYTLVVDMLRDSDAMSFVLSDISQHGYSTKYPRTMKLLGLYSLEVSLQYYQESHRKLGEHKGSHWVIPKDCINHNVLRWVLLIRQNINTTWAHSVYMIPFVLQTMHDSTSCG